MTTTTRPAPFSLSALFLAVSLLPMGLCAAQDRGGRAPAPVQGILDAPRLQEPAAGPVRNLVFSVYEVPRGDWTQVLGKSLLLSEMEPLARGRGASGLIDLELRNRVLPDRAGKASFAMRFEGLITAKEAGQYTFRLKADDQAQLFLNGKLVGNYIGNGQGEAKVAAVTLAKGDHKLQVDFADWGGAWWLELAMTEPGGREVALSSAARGAEAPGQDRRRAKMKLAPREPVPVDWDAEYEAFLKANPKVGEQVKAGRITKDQVIAGMKARAKEVDPEEDPEIERLLARFEAMRPGSAESLRKMLVEGRLTKKDLLTRLEGRGVRARAQKAEEPMEGEGEPALGRGVGEGRGGEDPAPEVKRPSREDYARLAAEVEKAVAAGEITAEQGRERLLELRRSMSRRGEAPNAEREAPAPEAKRPTREDYARLAAEVEKAVAAGEITAEQGREKLVELRRSMSRRRVAPKPVDWDAEYEAFLKANPKVHEQVAAGKVTKDQVLAGIKARSKEVEPEKDPELEGILARFEALRPGSAKVLRQSLAEGRTTKEELLARLKGVEVRGRGDGEGERERGGDELPPKRGGGEKRSSRGDGERSRGGDGGR